MTTRPGRSVSSTTVVALEQSVVHSSNIAVIQGQNVKNKSSKQYYSFVFAFAVSSTAFLNAPRSAVS